MAAPVKVGPLVSPPIRRFRYTVPHVQSEQKAHGDFASLEGARTAVFKRQKVLDFQIASVFTELLALPNTRL